MAFHGHELPSAICCHPLHLHLLMITLFSTSVSPARWVSFTLWIPPPYLTCLPSPYSLDMIACPFSSSLNCICSNSSPGEDLTFGRRSVGLRQRILSWAHMYLCFKATEAPEVQLAVLFTKGSAGEISTSKLLIKEQVSQPLLLSDPLMWRIEPASQEDPAVLSRWSLPCWSLSDALNPNICPENLFPCQDGFPFNGEYNYTFRSGSKPHSESCLLFLLHSWPSHDVERNCWPSIWQINGTHPS